MRSSLFLFHFYIIHYHTAKSIIKVDHSTTRQWLVTFVIATAPQHAVLVRLAHSSVQASCVFLNETMHEDAAFRFFLSGISYVMLVQNIWDTLWLNTWNVAQKSDSLLYFTTLLHTVPCNVVIYHHVTLSQTCHLHLLPGAASSGHCGRWHEDPSGQEDGHVEGVPHTPPRHSVDIHGQFWGRQSRPGGIQCGKWEGGEFPVNLGNAQFAGLLWQHFQLLLLTGFWLLL